MSKANLDANTGDQAQSIDRYLQQIEKSERCEKTDISEMSRLIEKMRGDKSLSSFAREMRIAPSTLTRIVNGEVRKVSKKILTLLIMHLDPDCGVTVEELMAASGLIETKKNDLIENAEQFEEIAQQIIRNDLYRAGIMFVKSQDESILAPHFSWLYPDLAIETDINGIKKWIFSLMFFEKERRCKDGSTSSSYTFVVRRLLEYVGSIMAGFYCGTDISKWSIVVNRREVVDIAVEKISRILNGRQIRDYISLILVNTEKRFVEREWLLPTTREIVEIFPLEPEKHIASSSCKYTDGEMLAFLGKGVK